MSWGARTQVEKGHACSLDFVIHALPEQNSTISATAFGGVCSVTIKRETLTEPEYVTPPEWWGSGMGYSGYLVYAEIALSDIPPQTERVDLYEYGLFWGPDHYPPEVVDEVIEPLPYTVSASWSVQGIVLRSQHVETPVRSEGGVTHPTECDIEEHWFALPDETSVTVTVGGLSYTDDYDLGEGEVDCHTGPWRMLFSCVLTGNANNSGTLLEFDNILLSDIPIVTDQCDQTSDTTWQTGRGWSTNDGGDYSATGSGNSISIVANSSSMLGANQWTGWADQPYAVNFAHVSVRTFLGDDWPEAIVDVPCLTNPSGSPFSDTVSALHELGTIISPDVYSWIAQNAYEVPPYVPWTGWKPGPSVALELDTDWLRENAEYQTNGDYNDNAIILDLWPLDAQDRQVDPHFRDVFELAHVGAVDVNDPPTTSARPTAYRPSLWVGSGGATVSETNNDLWTVAASAEDPKVTRSLTTLFWQRLAAYKAGTSGSYLAPGLPEAYLYDKANQDPNYPEPADGKTREDVTAWARYAYLRVGFDLPVACTLVMRIEWDEVEISDSHVTGSQRVEDFTYTAIPRAAEYTLAFTGTGSQYIDVDLLAGSSQLEATKMHQVSKIEFSGFPVDEERDFTLETLELRQHPTHSIRHCKRVDPWTYSEVGFSMVVDGAVNALAVPDNYRENVEDGLGVIRWLFGANTGIDMSGAMLLTDLVNVFNNLEGLTCSWHSGNWDDHTLDGDENRLCSPWPWHLVEAEARDEDAETDNWNWHMAIRARSIEIVRGLTYKIYADKILRMGAHGVAWSGGARAATTTVYIWSRPVGESTWTQVGTCTSDDIGYFYEGELPVLAVQGEEPPTDDIKYEYGISTVDDEDEVESVGTGHQREWVQRPALLLVAYHPSAVDDRAFAVVTLVYQRYSDQMLMRRWDHATGWGGVAVIPMSGNWPWITRYHMASVQDLVYVYDGNIRAAEQAPMQNTWMRDGVQVAGDLCAADCGPHGLGVLYYSSGDWLFQLYERGGTGTSRTAIGAAVTINAGLADVAAVARQHDTWVWYVAIPVMGGVELYRGEKDTAGGGELAFTLLRSFSGMTKPGLVCLPWGLVLAGCEEVSGDFEAKAYVLNLTDGTNLRDPVTAIEHVHEDRLALVNVAPLGKLMLLASGPSTDPGLLVYASGDYGHSWTKETVLS